VNTFADRLKAALIRSGLKQNDFEAKAKLAKGYATRLLDGDRVGVASDRLEAIAEVLHVNYVWLATGRGHMNASEPSKYSTLERLFVEHPDDFTGADQAELRSMRFAGKQEPTEEEWYRLRDESKAARKGKRDVALVARTSDEDDELDAHKAAMKAKLPKSKVAKPKKG
jgi:transcriptional regulator with XRE-family HTH domain